MSRYYYADVLYDTIDDLNTAITSMKNKLENNPTLWCSVRIVEATTVDGVDAWIMKEKLSDSEINSLTDSDTKYAISALISEHNEVGITYTQLKEKIKQYRTPYALLKGVHKYGDQNDYSEHNVTNEDMSGYV